MKSITKLTLTATLALAITLTLTACEEKKKQDGTTATEPAAEAATQEAAAQEAVVEEPKAVEVVKGSFTDTRDSKTYKTAKIGTQVWMAENLNYEAKEGSMCYDNKPDNCKKYGRLYDFETAKKACHTGWHLPSKAEWQTLVNLAGGDRIIAGKKLRAKSGWNDHKGKSCNGTDELGFSALPGGFRSSNDCPDVCEEGYVLGEFFRVGEMGFWWSSDRWYFLRNIVAIDGELDYIDGVNIDYIEGVTIGETYQGSASELFSVRCIKD
jgi:uncharacterized protein (TIGR02145 family)